MTPPCRCLVALLALALSGQAPAESIAVDSTSPLVEISHWYIARLRDAGSIGGREDYSAAFFQAEIAAQRDKLERLEAMRADELSLQQDIDYRLLTGILRADIHTAERQRRWENDAALYLPSRQLGHLLQPGYPGGADQHRQELETVLAALPARLAQGRANLRRPPRRFTEAALFQARNIQASLTDESGVLAEPDQQLAALLDAARESLAEYLAFLEQDLLPRSDGDWALGKPAYDYILRERWHLDADAEAILARGQAAFEETEALAIEVAARMAPGRHWTEVYESLKDHHPAAADLKQAYQQQMDAAQVFVREHQIVTLPEGERVITLDTPPAMRRSSPFGTFQTADPFMRGLEGRLILTPIEDWMSPEQQAQRLRSHHRDWIPIIAVHEAYPGHHVQALLVNQNPNPLRRVIRESIFSEGWGLFTEEMMFEQGFLAGDPVRLTQLRNRLWRAARVILDVSLHTGRMDFDAAVNFLAERVRFEPYAAELEVGMYVRRPTYVLGYLIGMQEIEAIRADWIARHGQPEPPSRFYDRLLSIGSIPPALLREELFAAPP